MARDQEVVLDLEVAQDLDQIQILGANQGLVLGVILAVVQGQQVDLGSQALGRLYFVNYNIN